MPSNKVKREEKSEPSKFVKELILFRLLYEDSKMRDDSDLPEADKLGLSLDEINKHYFGIDAKTLNRFLFELRRCGAVGEIIAYNKNGRIRAEFKPYAEIKCMDPDEAGATTHLARLSRTIVLMRKWLENDNLPSHNPLNSKVGRFFWSIEEAGAWYFSAHNIPEPEYRTIQRDVHDVCQALDVFDKR